MPRARSQAIAILQRLNDVRQNIRALLQSLEQVDNLFSYHFHDSLL